MKCKIFKTRRAYVFWLSFDRTKLLIDIKKKIFFSNSISSPPENCLGANLALIFVNFYICSKLELIIWFWTIILFIILYFQFGGVLGKIFLPKCLNFEIHSGRYLAKKFKKWPKKIPIFQWILLIQGVLPFQKCVKKWNRCDAVLGCGKGVY